MKNPLDLYTEHRLRRHHERLRLFEILRDAHSIDLCLCPGCFVHLTPALVFPKTTFVDTDRRGERFWFSRKRPAEYFRPKKRISVTRGLLHDMRRGVGHTTSANSCVFQKVR